VASSTREAQLVDLAILGGLSGNAEGWACEKIGRAGTGPWWRLGARELSEIAPHECDRTARQQIFLAPRVTSGWAAFLDKRRPALLDLRQS